MEKDYSKKPRVYMLMEDVNYFGKVVPSGPRFYNFTDLDVFTPCLITEGNVPVLDFTKSIDFRNVISNKDYFCEKEYLAKLNEFFN